MQSELAPADNLFINPRNVGDASEPNFVGRAASFACGATIRVSLHISESRRITEAKFKAAGCTDLVAAASLLTELVQGETTAGAAALGQHSSLLKKPCELSGDGRSECAELAREALIAAIAQYSDSIREGWEGDEALICTCFGVSERRIEQEIQTHRLNTIAEVTQACNAGAGCRSCYSLIEDILGEVNGE